MKKIFLLLIICISFSFTGCFSEKKSPFYNSDWIMYNKDSGGERYYHLLRLKPDHTVTLTVSYVGSTNIIEWSGKYKINAKQIVFDFTECTRFENLQEVEKYTSGKIINYYNGKFLYSLGYVENEDKTNRYHLQLIRPGDFFLGDAIDIYGNQLEEFEKVE